MLFYEIQSITNTQFFLSKRNKEFIKYLDRLKNIIERNYEITIDAKRVQTRIKN